MLAAPPPSSLTAQHPSTAAMAVTAASVHGQLLEPGGPSGPVPLRHYWVTLHRVGPDSAAPVDSMRTDGTGHYGFAYRRWGSPDAIYFASATYGGVAYFTQPLRGPRATGLDAEIMVFDTTSGPIPLHVRGRHVIVSAASASGLRSVIEVFELSNDSSLTLISPSASDRTVPHPSWQAAIPLDASDFQGGQGDVPPDAISAVPGHVQIYAPFAPGLKQFSYSYALPPSAFPLRLTMEAPTSVLEVLLEEPGARASGPRLREVDPAAVASRVFRRFLAQDIPAGTVLRIVVPAGATTVARDRFIAVVCGALGLAMLAALAFAFFRQ